MVQPRQQVVPHSKQPNSARALETSCPHPHRPSIIASVDVSVFAWGRYIATRPSALHSLCRGPRPGGKLNVFIGAIKFLDRKDLSQEGIIASYRHADGDK